MINFLKNNKIASTVITILIAVLSLGGYNFSLCGEEVTNLQDIISQVEVDRTVLARQIEQCKSDTVYLTIPIEVPVFVYDTILQEITVVRVDTVIKKQKFLKGLGEALSNVKLNVTPQLNVGSRQYILE